jgi:hypothetical protein
MAKSSRGQKLNWYKTLRGAELTSGEFRILVLLSTYTNEHLENAHPGVELLAQDAGMTVRGVQLILRSLEDKGAILVTQEGGNKTFKGAATVYALQVSLQSAYLRVKLSSPLRVKPPSPFRAKTGATNQAARVKFPAPRVKFRVKQG